MLRRDRTPLREWNWTIVVLIFSFTLNLLGLFFIDVEPGHSFAHMSLLIALFGIMLPNVLAWHNTTQALKEVTTTINSVVTFAPEIRDNQVCVETLKLLAHPAEGIERAKHIFVIQKASSRLSTRYYTEFRTDSYKNDEFRRIDLLGDVLAYAKSRVLTYSYADRDYLHQFWGSPDPSIHRYFEIHQEVLNRRGNKIEFERVFVYPDDLPSNAPTAFAILINTIARLRNAGMTDHLYVATEQAVRRHLQQSGIAFQRRGFFLGDESFVSRERNAARALCPHCARPESQGPELEAYAIFDCIQDDAASMLELFKEMKLATYGPLTAKEFDNMLTVRNQSALHF